MKGLTFWRHRTPPRRRGVSERQMMAQVADALAQFRRGEISAEAFRAACAPDAADTIDTVEAVAATRSAGVDSVVSGPVWSGKSARWREEAGCDGNA